MIPSIVYSSRDLQTDFNINEPTVRLTVSRGREVVIRNDNLNEGLYLFKYHEEDKVYKGVPTYTANLAAIKLKALSQGQTIIAPVTKAYRKIIKASDLDQSILDSLFNREVELDELKGFTFEVRAQAPAQVTTKRNDITSIEIENQFRSGAAYRRGTPGEDYGVVQSMDGTNEDVFLAYIFKDGNQWLVLIDIGELWDTRRISFDDLLDILSHDKAPRVDEKQWAQNVGVLTPEQKQEISDNYATIQRTKAFDDIMKQNNPNFDSNKEN